MEAFPDGDIYAGLSGLELEADEVDLGDRVALRRTYAHLMIPFLMSFSPTAPGGFPPTPWKSGQNGFDFEIVAELVVPKEVSSNVDERIRTARLIVALMRTWGSPTITVPMISNVSFSSAVKIPDGEVRFLPLEIMPKHFKLESPDGSLYTADRLKWVKLCWASAVKLVSKNAELRLAMDTLDRGQFIQNPALALVSLWGSLEALFSPSPTELSFRLASSIASYLEEPGEARLELHRSIMRLYKGRSAAAHGRPKVKVDTLLQTFELLRKVVIRMISYKHIPSKEELEALLFGVGKGNPKEPNEESHDGSETG